MEVVAEKKPIHALLNNEPNSIVINVVPGCGCGH